MSADTYVPECPESVYGTHVYGTRERCLSCGEPNRDRRPRPFTPRFGEVVDVALRERPGVLVTTGRDVRRTPGVEDVAGWGENGDPWMGGAE